MAPSCCCSISDSLSSCPLSAIELCRVLPSSTSELATLESFNSASFPSLDFLSRPHFFKTGSRYFFKCSPRNKTQCILDTLCTRTSEQYNVIPLSYIRNAAPPNTHHKLGGSCCDNISFGFKNFHQNLRDIHRYASKIHNKNYLLSFMFEYLSCKSSAIPLITATVKHHVNTAFQFRILVCTL